MDDLKTLTREPARIEIAGEALAITPLRVKQIPGFVREIGPALAGLSGGNPDWISLLGVYGDSLINAVAIAVGRDAAWVGNLELDDLLRLIAAVAEVNADFFAQRVAPLLDTVMARIGKAPGPTPSNG